LVLKPNDTCRHARAFTLIKIFKEDLKRKALTALSQNVVHVVVLVKLKVPPVSHFVITYFLHTTFP